MKIPFLAFLIMVPILIANKGISEETMQFQNIPKAELHLHLGGAYPKEYLSSISTTDQQKKLESVINAVANGVNYNAVFSFFHIISQIVNTEEKVQKGVEELCLSLQHDGVRYVEIRTGLKDLGLGYEEYLKAVLAGIRAHSSEQFKAKLVLSLQRNSTSKAAELTVNLAKKYQTDGVIGIDISGDSTIGQIEQIMPQLLSAKEAGLFFLVHLGEHPAEANQVYLLEKLEPKRVGHAVHLSDEAKNWIVSNKTPIEVCLSSSVLVQMVEHFNEHPGIELFRQGHPIVLCTDDPLLFSTTASKELQIAHQFCGLSKEEIEQIAHNSFQYALY